MKIGTPAPPYPSLDQVARNLLGEDPFHTAFNVLQATKSDHRLRELGPVAAVFSRLAQILLAVKSSSPRAMASATACLTRSGSR